MSPAARGLAFAARTSARFAGSFIAGKLATREVEPLSLSLARYVIAWAFLGGAALALGRRVPALGYLMLGSTVTPAQVAGASLVLLGLWLVMRDAASESNESNVRNPGG